MLSTAALGQAADAERRADDHQAGADRLQVGERRGRRLGRLGVRRAVGDEEEQPPANTDRLDQLHLTLDSLHFWRHASRKMRGNRPRPAGRDETTMASTRRSSTESTSPRRRPTRTRAADPDPALGSTRPLVGMDRGPDEQRGQKRKNVSLQKRHEQLEQAQEDHADDAGRASPGRTTGPEPQVIRMKPRMTDEDHVPREHVGE